MYSSLPPVLQQPPLPLQQQQQQQPGDKLGMGPVMTVSRLPEVLRVISIDNHGEGIRSQSSRAELASILGFPLRDLRCLTTSFHISQVLVRPGAFILNLKYARAIVTAGKVMLMDEVHVPDDLIDEVRRRIKSPFPGRSEPFELLVLEGILHYMHDRAKMDLDDLEPAIHALLASLETQEASEEQLRLLLNLSKRLGAFAYDIGELKGSLDKLLLSDEDMNQMCLSRPAASDAMRPAHDDLEILLENYSRRLEETKNAVSELQGYIQATEAYLKIHYDSQRNKIMKHTLVLSMATFSMSCGTAAAAVFGMNLMSSYEVHPLMFYWVTSGITGFSALTFTILMLRWRRRSLR